MRPVFAFLLLSMPAWGGYGFTGVLTFPPASGAAPDANITLAFSGADSRLKTVSNGGQIQHTTTRLGVTVPTDFVLTSDATCASITGYNWAIESYDATAGTLKGWVRIPSISPGSSVIVTACFGNSSVTTFQGGPLGGEYDAFTKGIWHFPNSPGLITRDFSSSGYDGTINGAVAVPGVIDGGASFSNAYIDLPQAAVSGATAVTFAVWMKTTSTARQFLIGDGVGVCGSNGFASLEINNLSSIGALIRADGGASAQAATNTSDGVWHRLVGIYTPTTLSIQVDTGVPSILGGLGNPPIGSSATLEVGNLCSNFGGGAFAFQGSLDEFTVSTTTRSPDWLATEYANQSNPPLLGAFAILSGGDAGNGGGSGPTITSFSQGFVF